MRKHWVVVLFASAVLLPGCGSEGRRRVMEAAIVGAIQQAREIQSVLAHSSRCPDELAGWKRPNGLRRLEKEIFTPDMHYRMYFTCNDDLSFDVAVKYDMDSGTFVSGRETGLLEITYGHFTATRKLKIALSDDAALIAARVVRDQ
jgi:hypothetical protein